MYVPLDENDPNIPILIRDGWVLQPDGSWLSSDKQREFYRTENDARRVMLHHAPPRNNRRLAREE